MARQTPTKPPTLKELRPHYSGPLSQKFWDRVNAHRDQEDNGDWRELYAAGVLLQNMESTVLTWLNSTPLPDKPKAGKR